MLLLNSVIIFILFTKTIKIVTYFETHKNEISLYLYHLGTSNKSFNKIEFKINKQNSKKDYSHKLSLD
jgi:hypothetical protein